MSTSYLSLPQRQRREIAYWRDAVHERPDVESVEAIIAKCCEAQVFLLALARFQDDFQSASNILELGGGQGWAAAVVKRRFPAATVITSDISRYAVASLPKWNRVFNTCVDGAFACRSYEVPCPDASQDLIFAYAAAHHFGAQRKTLMEIYRLLRPGGVALYLHEPTCPPWLYACAFRRVNRNRPDVPEDVLVYPKIVSLAREVGLLPEVHFAPVTVNRRPGPLLYYTVLSRLRFLQRWLPCTAHYRFVKPLRGASSTASRH